MNTFEVGKVYRNKASGCDYEVLYVYERQAFAKLVNTKYHHSSPVILFDQQYYKEVEKPVVFKDTRYIFLDPYNKKKSVATSATKGSYNGKPIGAVEFTVTDGKLTSVEIVK